MSITLRYRVVKYKFEEIKVPYSTLLQEEYGTFN